MAASNASASTAKSAASDRELIFTRVFDVPRELVFEAWTDPKHLVHWRGPRGFRTTIHEMDVRPGGVWRLVMHGPDGVDYRNRIVFIEVVKPERLVYKHDPEEGCEQVRFEITVTFAEHAGQTTVTMRMLFPSAAELERVAKKYGAIEGAHQTLSRLGEHLPSMTAPVGDLVITRLFDAPREMVFKAWTEPERLREWWGPKGFTTPVCELDARPGGVIRIHMRAPDGTVFPNRGVFLEVVFPERLVFKMGTEDQQGNLLIEGINTMTFSEQDGKTTLTMRARIVKPNADAMFSMARMEQGWNQTLERLAERLVVESRERIS